MQGVPLLPAPAVTRSGDAAPAAGARARNAAQPATGAARAVAATATAGSPAALRRGHVGWNPQLHQQLSDAQQAQDFLDQTAAQLQSLKADLSAKIETSTAFLRCRRVDFLGGHLKNAQGSAPANGATMHGCSSARSSATWWPTDPSRCRTACGHGRR